MMKPHQVRVVTELSELRTKIGKLDEFLTSNKIVDLTISEIKLMELQLFIMVQYLEVLNERIRNF